jgi:ankyrin repeat protein
VALSCGYLKIVRELLKYDVDPTIVDNSNKTAFDYAKEEGFHECMTLLLNLNIKEPEFN